LKPCVGSASNGDRSRTTTTVKRLREIDEEFRLFSTGFAEIAEIWRSFSSITETIKSLFATVTYCDVEGLERTKVTILVLTRLTVRKGKSADFSSAVMLKARGG
jgi:hypothetical protein